MSPLKLPARKLPIGTFRADSFAGDIQGRKLVLDGGTHLRIRQGAGRATK